MKGTHLGEFEELVLLTTAILNDNAYTVTIADEILGHTDRSVTLSSIHTVLVRLEKKGFVQSYMGGSTQERGGRRRRLYKITATGYECLNAAKQVRDQMWSALPKLSFDFSV
ncbi:MAG: helix-turn-helix transcriptional regulator [Marinoscillum sp.]